MRKELKALKGTVERVGEGFEISMQENEERMEAMMGQVMGMMKTFTSEGAVGGVASASGKGLIVEEKAKVSDNGEGSDREIEDKGIRHLKDEQEGYRKNEKKGKSNVKREKKKRQDESEDDHEQVKVISKKKGKKRFVKDRNLSAELDSLYSNEEEGNEKGLGSEDSSEDEVEVCKKVVMREVPRCERFNEHSSRDVYDFFGLKP
ncbi:uncharacterized protein [Palaemon carinicauda]|uniref:uncharacterized protein n=1 Tax=Palaemon carinicauda TaxID=392227 RepID=UPI0035B65782